MPHGDADDFFLWLLSSTARLGNGKCHWAQQQSAAGVSRGGGEEAQKSELCQTAESGAGEPCCQSHVDELESGKSWVQSSLMSREIRLVLF